MYANVIVFVLKQNYDMTIPFSTNECPDVYWDQVHIDQNVTHAVLGNKINLLFKISNTGSCEPLVYICIIFLLQKMLI